MRRRMFVLDLPLLRRSVMGQSVAAEAGGRSESRRIRMGTEGHEPVGLPDSPDRCTRRAGVVHTRASAMTGTTKSVPPDQTGDTAWHKVAEAGELTDGTLKRVVV